MTVETAVRDGAAVMRAENVTKEFGGLVAVNDVTLDIPRHSIVSLIGPNGAGKTTLFNMLTGLYKPTSGHIVLRDPRQPPSELFRLAYVRGWAFHPLAVIAAALLTAAGALISLRFTVAIPVLLLAVIVATDNQRLTDSRWRATTWLTLFTGPIGFALHAWRRRRVRPVPVHDITRTRPDIITRMGVARTFQNIRLFGAMSAVENVMVGRHGLMTASLVGSILRVPRVRREERAVRARARELLSYVGLPEELHDQMASHLSYGDQRRVEIARALAADPQVLLLDEPTAGMNPQESTALTAFMRRLRDELGLAILLIEHDMKVVMDVSERVTVLDHGEKIAEGEPAEVRTDPRVIEAYLGKQE